MKILCRLSLVVAAISCGQLAIANNTNLELQIEAICHVAALNTSATNYDNYEKQLLQLASGKVTSEDRGTVFAAIAEIYGHSMENFSEKTVYYSKAALNERISILKSCDLYLLSGNAMEATGRREIGVISSMAFSNSAKLYVQGLDFALEHLQTNKMVPPPSVGKFDVEPTDPQYQNVVRLHEEQVTARNKILEQNQLINFRDEFKRRLLLLYSLKVPSMPSLDKIVSDAIGDDGRSEKILGLLKLEIPQVK